VERFGLGLMVRDSRDVLGDMAWSYVQLRRPGLVKGVSFGDTTMNGQASKTHLPNPGRRE
jgi:hypothetical protein